MTDKKDWFNFHEIMDQLQNSGHPQAVKAFLFLLNSNKILRKENGYLRTMYLGASDHLTELQQLGKHIRKLISNLCRTEKAMRDGEPLHNVKQSNKCVIKKANQELEKHQLPIHTGVEDFEE